MGEKMNQSAIVFGILVFMVLAIMIVMEMFQLRKKKEQILETKLEEVKTEASIEKLSDKDLRNDIDSMLRSKPDSGK